MPHSNFVRIHKTYTIKEMRYNYNLICPFAANRDREKERDRQATDEYGKLVLMIILQYIVSNFHIILTKLKENITTNLMNLFAHERARAHSN